MIRFVAVLLLFTLASPSLWGQRTTLAQRLDSLIKKKLPPGSDVGVSVYDLTDKKQLYAYRDDKLCRPASNMKLLTVFAALSRLEYNDPFRTEVWYKGTIDRDTLTGDLYVIGGFDPEFKDSAMNVLTEQIRILPFSVVKGKVYGDVSMKDSLYWGSGWSWDDTPESYQPYMTPLMFNKGFVSVTATPGKAGNPASIACEPVSSFYSLSNETQSRTPSAGKFSVSRNWLEGGNNIVVKGNVEHRRTSGVNMYPAEDFFMHVFIERLQAKGLDVNPEYGFAEFVQDSLSHRIAGYETPLQEVVNETMKESDNLGAEALLCKLAVHYKKGKRVSWNDGLEVIREQIKLLGHDPENYKLADGSGLSSYNYVSPALLVDLLRYCYGNTELFQRLYKSLPIGGVDGTLEHRMRKGTKAYMNVHAKTGTITGISTLSGYLKSANGHNIAFAIMNQNGLSGAKSRELQNLICEMLCE